MRYYQALEIQKDGKHTGLWHYTCTHDKDTYPVGGCGMFRKCTACNGRVTNPGGLNTPSPDDCKVCQGAGAEKIPEEERCKGHDTPEGAQEHYKQYLLEDLHFFGPKGHEWPKYKCKLETCPKEATHMASIPGHSMVYELCEEHCTREVVSDLLKVGEMWCS